MYQTSEEFGNLIQQDSRTFYALLYFDGNTITDGISEITIEGGSNSEDDFSIGSVVSRYAKIKMTNPAKRIEGKEITINIGMMVGESIEYVPMGYYTAEKPKTDESQITVTAYDRMMKTERAFSADGIAETTDTVTVLNAISRITGVTVVTDGLTAISMQRPDSYTCREILGYISQMYGGFAICNRQGQIEIKTYIDSDYPVDTSRYWDTFEHHDVTEKIEKITCYIGKDSDGNDVSVSVGSGTREISFSNPFMTQEMLDNVWKVLSGYEYMPGSIKFMGDPRVDPWDVLTVSDLNGTAYKVPVMTMTHEFDGGLITSVEAVGRSEVEQESGYKGPTTKEMDRYYAQLVVIDKALINKLDVDTANITYATIKNLEVTKERVEEIYGEYGEFQKLTVNNFSAANGRIDILASNYANIKNLLSGSAGIGDLQNIHLTSDNAVIDTALIRTAVMESVSIADLLAGTISTNKFKIMSDDGGIQISGATQQWKDDNGVVRMQAGRDAQGSFTFELFDETGKGVLIDSTGVQPGAIADGLIVNEMVSDTANIAASKLDIDSLFTAINDSTQVINTDCKTVILSPGIYEIEKWAFRNSHLEQLYLYDDLEKISDYAFQDCDMLHTLHINAIEAPAYSGNYFDTFQDKYDRLLSMKDKKKIVLFSGSSTRFGYDSEMIDQAFPDYEVVNMGVFAYSPALPQLELIRSCMKEGDVLLDSPEFDAANRQFCYQKELDYATFAMMESDYDVFAQLDLREYKQIFTAFTAYQDARADMERKNYDVCASEYDEDGNEVEEPSYNEYGDYVVYRPNSTSEKPIYGLPVNYTVNAYPKDTYIDSINTEFQRFLDQGIKVYFTYSPRNKYALSEDSTQEERIRLHEYFKSQLNVPVISELEDSLYTGIYLYGTDNHLSTEGAQIRTEKVIRDLKEQFAKEEKK